MGRIEEVKGNLVDSGNEVKKVFEFGETLGRLGFRSMKTSQLKVFRDAGAVMYICSLSYWGG